MLHVNDGLLHYSKELLGGFISRKKKVVLYNEIRKRRITVEETWVHHHTLVRKHTRNKWKLRGSP